MADRSPITTRRTALALLATPALAMGLPALAASRAKAEAATDISPELRHAIAEHDAARDRLDAPLHAGIDLERTDRALYDRLEREYSEAVDRLDSYRPQTQHEFLVSFAARFWDGSHPNEDMMDDIIADALRLTGETL